MEIIKVDDDTRIKLTARLAGEIWRQHFRGIISVSQIEYMLEKFQSYEAIKRQIENEEYSYFLMETGKSGFFGYFAVSPAGRDLLLSKIYIKKESRGNGYARKAIEFIKNFAVDRNLGGIVLTVNRGNTSAVNIYKKMGFNIIDEADTDIGGGFFMNDHIMRLEVKQWIPG